MSDPALFDRGQLPLELGHSPALGEADFLVSDGNRLAYAHILAYPHWHAPLTLLQGPPKSGKSHLARIFADRAGAHTPAADTLEDLARAGGSDPLIIEDADRGGYAEPALFHLLNQAMRDHRPMLLTAREPISNWPYQTADVLSRARLAALFTVSSPDDIQLSQMLVKLFGDRQVTVDPRVVAYIVPRMERSPEEAVALVDLLDRLALARGTAITRAIAAEALALRGATQLELELEGDDSDE
jgi:chromosomal replication initiation ATPase DnaA